MATSLIVSRPWPPQMERLTLDDAIASGACAIGVYEWISDQDISATAPSVADLLEISSGTGADEYIKRAAGLTGNGDGDGYGDGYGDGDGYGNGYGDGYGNGYGDGNY